MKIDPHYIAAAKMLANDCSLWKYNVYADTRGGSSNDSEVVDDCNFRRFRWLLLLKLQLDIRPVLLYGDMLPLNGCN